MIFSTKPRETSTNLPIYIISHAIFPSSHCTFLGVELDSYLKFDIHINSLAKKCAYGIRLLLKARSYFGTSTLITLYYAFIYSHINYCISSWGLTYSSHLASLQHVQNQAVRIITHSPYNAHVTPLYRQLNFLPLPSILNYNLGIMAYHVINNPRFIYILGRTSLSNPNKTRFALQNNFLLPKIRTNYGKLTVEFSAIKFWNELPVSMKSTSSFPTFKRLLRLYCVNNF